MGEQIVNPQQFQELLKQATGGLIDAQPAQQLFQSPTPAAMQQPVQAAPEMMMQPPLVGQPAFQSPASQAVQSQQIPSAPQIAPPGSERQTEYEKMREDTNKFLHGLIDGAMPYIAKEVVNRMTEEEKKAAAEKVINDEEAKKVQFGTFKNFLLGVGGAVAGYGIASYLIKTFSDDKEKAEEKNEEVVAAIDSLSTIFA